ncbi:MAG: MFS transporter [Victivallales bacterium]|nr:MFS transporter [Victivallales bacterium]
MKAVLRNNFRYHIYDGVLYICGICFIAYETVLPKMIESLDGTAWMISFAPMLTLIGSTFPSVIAAGYVDRLPRKKHYIIVSGIIQRLPFFLTALLLWTMNAPHFLVWCIMTAVFINGIFSGVLSPAWFQFVANTVPARYVPRLFAIRYGLGSAIGIFIGLLVKVILEYWPEKNGFGVLFLAAGMATMASLLAVAKVQEPERRTKTTEAPGSYREVWRQSAIMKFIVVRAFYCGVYIGLAFIPIRICAVLQLPNSWLGIFTLTVVCGAIAGNIFTSIWTHRWSWRTCQIISLAGYGVMFLLCLGCYHLVTALVIFFLLGFSRDVWNSVSAAYMLNLPGPRLRAKGTAFIALTMMPPLLVAGVAGGKLMSWFNSYSLVFIVAALTMIPAIHYSRQLPER